MFLVGNGKIREFKGIYMRFLEEAGRLSLSLGKFFALKGYFLHKLIKKLLNLLVNMAFLALFFHGFEISKIKKRFVSVIETF